MASDVEWAASPIGSVHCGAGFWRVRLEEARRQGGKVIHWRWASLSCSVRAVMSLSRPIGLRQFHWLASCRLS